MRTRTRLAAAGILLVAGLALSGCSAIQGIFGGPSVSRDADTQEVTEAGTADVFTMRVGDCYDDQSADEVSDVPAVPCADPHDNEAYFQFSMDGDEWPGDDAITAAADEQCTPEFEKFVGIAYADSVLDWYPITPTQGSWEELGDRVVICSIYEPSTKVQGSLAGVAR